MRIYYPHPALIEALNSKPSLNPLVLLLAGTLLLLADGAALALCADAYPVEAVIFAVLTIPASVFVIRCAFVIRNSQP
jgi:hypothetical protein